MANQKISALPEATLPLEGTELVPVVQGGENRRAPASAFGSSNGGGGGATEKIAYCVVGGNGTLLEGSRGIQSVTRFGTGDYEIAFEAGFFTSTPICSATIEAADHNAIIALVSGANAEFCSVLAKSLAGDPANGQFHFIAIASIEEEEQE